LNPESIMPPWGTHGLFSVDEIRDLVAFLQTLREPARFASIDEDPVRRAVPIETRDNLEPTENPAAFLQDRGAALFRAAGPQGNSCASCHAQPAREFRRWAAGMPRFEPRLGKVLGVEEFVARHARATTSAEYLMEQTDNLALSIYLRGFANGATLTLDTQSAGAREALLRGQALMKRKIGQLDFSCLDCHDPEKAGRHWMRGQYLGEVKNLLGHFPTWRTSRGEAWDIRKRFQWCNVSVRANELPPDAPEYGDLELALSALNAGRKLSVPGIRH
jgi:sulfur-oxidizing protein SoxA